MRRAGDSTRRLLLLTMLLSALLTAIIGLNGSVAALLPMAVAVAIRRSLPPSQLLMPLAFAGSAGGMLLLTGSPVNVVISEAAGEAGVGTFGFAEFALAGVPLVAGTVLVVMRFGQRPLPHRTSGAQAPDLSGHAATLVSHYSLDDVFHLRVRPASTLVGSARDHWGDLQSYEGVNVITVLDGESHLAVFDGVVAAGDRLTVIGRPTSYAGTPTTVASGSSRRGARPTWRKRSSTASPGRRRSSYRLGLGSKGRRRVPVTSSTVAFSCSPCSDKATTAAPPPPSSRWETCCSWKATGTR